MEPRATCIWIPCQNVSRVTLVHGTAAALESRISTVAFASNFHARPKCRYARTLGGLGKSRGRSPRMNGPISTILDRTRGRRKDSTSVRDALHSEYLE